MVRSSKHFFDINRAGNHNIGQAFEMQQTFIKSDQLIFEVIFGQSGGRYKIRSRSYLAHMKCDGDDRLFFVLVLIGQPHINRLDGRSFGQSGGRLGGRSGIQRQFEIYSIWFIFFVIKNFWFNIIMVLICWVWFNIQMIYGLVYRIFSFK